MSLIAVFAHAKRGCREDRAQRGNSHELKHKKLLIDISENSQP